MDYANIIQSETLLRQESVSQRVNKVGKLAMYLRDALSPLIWEQRRTGGGVPASVRFLCCHSSSCLWCTPASRPHLLFTAALASSPSPTVHRRRSFEFDAGVLIDWIASARRSPCSRGSTTWRTRSCWTWSPCWRASAKRRTSTASYRVWGTGSRRLPGGPLDLTTLFSSRALHSRSSWRDFRSELHAQWKSKGQSACGVESCYLSVAGLFVQDSYWQMIILNCTYYMFLRARRTQKVIFLSETIKWYFSYQKIIRQTEWGGFFFFPFHENWVTLCFLYLPRRAGCRLSSDLFGCFFSFKQLWSIFSCRMKCLHYCAEFVVVGVKGCTFFYAAYLLKSPQSKWKASPWIEVIAIWA